MVGPEEHSTEGEGAGGSSTSSGSGATAPAGQVSGSRSHAAWMILSWERVRRRGESGWVGAHHEGHGEAALEAAAGSEAAPDLLDAAGPDGVVGDGAGGREEELEALAGGGGLWSAGRGGTGGEPEGAACSVVGGAWWREVGGWHGKAYIMKC